MAQLKLKLGQSEELRVITGDCMKILPTLAADSIQCCVTSPPYWGLRDYDHEDQIGSEVTPELYVQNLVAVFREVRRTLRQNGTLWLNVGDGYARNGGTGKCGPNAIVGNTKKLIQKRNCKVPDVWGLKDRDLMGLPWRVAFGLQRDGWILRSKIVWIKKTAMPESVKNRPTNATEEISYSRNHLRITMIHRPFAKRQEQIFVTIGFWDLIRAIMVIQLRFLVSWQDAAFCWGLGLEIIS